MSRPPDERIAVALRESSGSIPIAAASLGLSAEELAAIIATSPVLGRLASEGRHRMARAAFDALLRTLEAGDARAATYVLDRLGHLVGLGQPTVTIHTHDDPLDVIARIDALERELAGQRIPLRDALHLVELRRAAVADMQRSGNIDAILQNLAAEVVRVLEKTIRDPDARAQVIRELAGVFGTGTAPLR